MDLTEAEDPKKRWQEYTEELYRKDLHDPDNYDGVITHLEPDILECEVKWAFGRITRNTVSGDPDFMWNSVQYDLLREASLACDLDPLNNHCSISPLSPFFHGCYCSQILCFNLSLYLFCLLLN